MCSPFCVEVVMVALVFYCILGLVDGTVGMILSLTLGVSGLMWILYRMGCNVRRR